MRLLQGLCLFLIFAILSPALRGIASHADGARMGAAQEAPRDPAAPGPYGVGVTTRTFANASPAANQANSLETVIWYPASATVKSSTPDPTLGAVVDADPDRAAAPYPVLVWSHGKEGPLGTIPRTIGEPWGSSYLATHLAGHGFIVVAPRHPDTFPSDRPTEVIFALDQALTASAGAEDAQLAGLLDRTRVGVGGHSAGASTALQVAGVDRRFSAVLALAAGSNPSTDSAVPNILAPTMMMTGGLDKLHPPYEQQLLLSLFPAAGPERWQVVLPRAGHFAFSDNCGGTGCGPDDISQAKAHDLINRWATVFLQARVSLDDNYLPFLDPMLAGADPDVNVTRIQGP